jgi:2-dehydropantoate 2-reductase
LVETPSGLIVARHRVLTDPREAPPVDWILVATKAYDAAGAAAWFPGLAARGAAAAILQNGVEHRERFSPYLPAERLLPVVVECPVERTEPTRIRQRGTGRLTVPDEPLGRDFAALFAATEIELTLTPDFKTAVWRKLCFNSVGIIPTLLLQPSGIFRDEAVAEAARQLVNECAAVGRAEGALLPDDIAAGVLAGYAKAPPDSINSLHADRLAGRPMEIDARNGVIVRLGRRHGIATPGNQIAVALLEAMAKHP